MAIERVFVIGGTGNVGKKVVEDLISKKTQVTLFARNPAKVNSLFSSGSVNIIEGNLNDLEPLKEAFKGHTRLFIVVNALENPIEHIKATVAKYAYEAGIQQIVDVSSISVGFTWRVNTIGESHAKAEKAMLNIPNRGNLVVLRPGRFMSNVITLDRISPDGFVLDTYEENEPQGWISPNDIGAVAAAVLTEEIEKHGDAVYELVGDSITSAQRAQVLSRVLNKDIRYKKISVVDRYNVFRKFMPHLIAYEFSCWPILVVPEGKITSGIPILIGREPETFEQFITNNKHLL